MNGEEDESATPGCSVCRDDDDSGGAASRKIFHLGKLPVNTQLAAYYNVVHPDNGANWQLRAQVQFMFPKWLLH
jgi:hypothetical protein